MVILWDTMGNILDRCDTLDEAEEIMEEYGYTELARTYSGRDTNIAVLED